MTQSSGTRRDERQMFQGARRDTGECRGVLIGKYFERCRDIQKDDVWQVDICQDASGFIVRQEVS